MVSSAIAAIDIALWDLKARLLGASLLSVLGKSRDTIPAYGSGGFTSGTEKQLVDQMTGWATEGFGAVKMKIGRDPTADIRRVNAVHRALGTGTEIYVDANGAYGRKQALRSSQVFSDLGVTWLEEPVSYDDRAGLHLIVKNAPPALRVAAFLGDGPDSV